MISSDFFKQFSDFLLGETDFENIFRSLEFLVANLNLNSLSLLLEDQNNSRVFMIGTDQYILDSEFIVKFPFPVENQKSMLIEDEEIINRTAFALETDSDPVSAMSVIFKPVNSDFNLILVAFAEKTILENTDLSVFLSIYGVYLSSNRFISHARERTNKISRLKVEEGLENQLIKTRQELFDSFSDGVIVLNKKCKVVYINKAAEKITGYSRNWLYNKDIRDVIPEYHRNIFKSSEFPESFEIDFITSSNELKSLSVNSGNLSGDVDLNILMFKDVTEQNLLQEQFKNTADLLVKMVDNSILGIIAAQFDGTVILFNPASAEMLNYRPETVLNTMNISQFFKSESKWAEILEKLKLSVAGEGGIHPFQDTIISSKGESIPVNISAFLVPGYKDGGSRIVLFLSDLRKQKEMEEKLDTIQKELEDSRKQAMITQLAGTMAHELNQPLMAIIGYAELITEKTLSEERLKKAVGHIWSEANRMAEIVKKIGNITKFETKKYVGHTNIFDLHKE